MTTRSASLTGIAGVHFVAAELAVNGIISAVTSRDVQGIDIIASRPDGSKSVSIQVKTSKKCEMTWLLNQKAESLATRMGVKCEPSFQSLAPEKDLTRKWTAEKIRNLRKSQAWT